MSCYIIIVYIRVGILTEIQDYFDIGDERAGLLQTAFVLSYMLFAPVFGYLGDRYSRRFIMAFGVLLWSLTTLIGSFMEVNEYSKLCVYIYLLTFLCCMYAL